MTNLSGEELLTTTRAVRKRLDFDRPVPTALVTECIEIAAQAPSGGNQQGWHWLVVTDQEKRRTIGDYYREAFRAYLGSANYPTNQDGGDTGWQATQQKVASSAEFLAERMGDVPVLVIPARTAPDGLPAGNQAGFWGSILPAAWSYCLAARDRGLGTAWTTLHLKYEREIAALLGIPDTVYQAALIPTAYYTGDTFSPAPRKPLDELVHHDAW